MHEIFATLASYIRPQILHVSIVVVTCALVVLESYIHGIVKGMIRSYHFVVRVAVYVVMFAFVYGFLVTYLSPRLAIGLNHLNSEMLVITLLVVFVIFGIMIERK